MSGETGQLQRLTDEQVQARLAAYNPGGSLDRDIALLRENATDIIAEAIIAQFGPERTERFAQNYAGKVDATWIQNVAEYGREIVRERMSVPAYMAARTQTADKIIAKYQTSSCEQLYLSKAQKEKTPPRPEEQEAIEFLRNHPEVRAAFIAKIAPPIANKMFDCGMIP